MCVSVCVCVYIYMCVCVYVYIYIYIYIYIYYSKSIFLVEKCCENLICKCQDTLFKRTCYYSFSNNKQTVNKL